MEIQEQVVLVTGGARGLGLAISQALLKQGARVVVNYLNSHSAAQDLQQQFPNQVLIYQADITEADQVLAMFKAAKHHFGSGITSVVNNALIKFEFNGEARPHIENLNWDNMQQQFEGAVKAAINTLQAGLEDMKAAQFGRVVNIGTNLVQNPVVPYHDYTAAKAAYWLSHVPVRMNSVNMESISTCFQVAYYKRLMPVKQHLMRYLI